MMKKHYKRFSYFISVLVIFSCGEKGEEFSRFPVIDILEATVIDVNQVKLTAKVRNFGAEEIEEFGFNLARVQDPNSDPIANKTFLGRPSQEFDAVLEVFMGFPTFYASAFIKTTRGIYYSPVLTFSGIGDGRFLITEVISTEKVSLGDTVNVIGHNFQSGPEEVKLTIFGRNIPIFDLNQNGFKFLLDVPILGQISKDEFELDLKVTEGTFQRNYKAKFLAKEPEFTLNDFQKIDFDNSISFLASGFISFDPKVKVGDIPVGYNINFDSAKEPFEVSFKPFHDQLTEPNPKVKVTIRGKDYDLGRLFEFNPSELEAGQVIDFNGTGHISIRAKNIPDSFGKFNQLVTADGDVIKYRGEMTYDGSILVDLSTVVLPGRRLELFLKNFGAKSQNSVTLNWNNPFILKKVLSNPLIYIRGMTLTIGDIGYSIADGYLYRIYLNDQLRQEKVLHYPGVENKSEIFLNAKNKLYVISSHFGGRSLIPNSFFELDPETGSFRKISDIPSEVLNPVRVYALNDDIIFEGGMMGAQPSFSRFKYSILFDRWEKIDEASDGQLMPGFQRDFVFHYKSQVYALKSRLFDLEKELMKLDPSTLTWSSLGEVFMPGNFATLEPLILDDQIFIRLSDNNFYNLNVEMGQVESLRELYFKLFGTSLNGATFQLNQKAIAVSQIWVVEFDPGFLD